MSDLSEQIKRAAEIKTRHENALLERAGVVGVGVGLRQNSDQVAIIVMVEQPIPDLPDEIEGFPVDVLHTGTISAE